VLLALAAVDALVGAYLLWYARAREHRDRDGVLVVGGALMAIALMLGTVAGWRATAREPVPVVELPPSDVLSAPSGSA